MATGGVFHEVAIYDQRPTWPYELWTFESEHVDNKEENLVNTECNGAGKSSDTIKKSQETSNKETSEHLTNKDELKDVDKSLNTAALNIGSKQKTEITEMELDHRSDINCQYSFSLQHNDQNYLNVYANTASTETENEKQNIDLTAQMRVKEYKYKNEDNFGLIVEDFKGDLETNEASDENTIDVGVPEYEPDHWTDELTSDIPKTCPINTLIGAVSSADISRTEAALQMKAELIPMLESTLANLQLSYKVFHDSYLMPVGSMAEHSKVGKPDEFDFAVILPLLAKEEYFGLLNKENTPVTDPTILNLVSDIWTGDIEAVANSFQQGLKDLWSYKMMECVGEDWTVLNPSGHSDTHSVAATFHLEKKSDHTRVDMDVCFWVPLNKESLLKLQSLQLQQKLYITRHCLDEHGLAYVIMPHDSDICLAINTVRFAMSRVERETLLKHGPENGRLICYRTCKSLVSALVPKIRKNDDCTHCFDSLISSYCLKNVVLYMAANHTSESYWAKDKLPNRVLEVFTILTFCMKVNAGQVSAYFTPYQLSTDWSMTYDASTKCVNDNDSNWYDSREIPCVLPSLTAIKALFINDTVSNKAVEDYEELLTNSEWRYPEVICRLAELLTNLAQIDDEDRQGLTDEPGWNLFGLDLSDGQSLVQSIETHL